MLNARPTIFRFRVLSLFRTFHARTTMLNARPTIFCFRALGLFASFGFVSNIPRTHNDAQRPPHDFLFPSFGFIREFWVCFEHSTHTPRCSTPAPRFFVSEFWVCLRVLGLFRTFHAHTTMLNARPTIFCFRVLGSFASCGFVSNIPRTYHDAQRPPHDFLFPSFGFISSIPRTHHDAHRPPHDFLFPSFEFVVEF